ncbi:hypothetical protein BDR04DRAFT_1119434 [Suillus decipiens]|nr:hypothetical protein BDR04DRAFT_1119434 [Suillus decipiens]
MTTTDAIVVSDSLSDPLAVLAVAFKHLSSIGQRENTAPPLLAALLNITGTSKYLSSKRAIDSGVRRFLIFIFTRVTAQSWESSTDALLAQQPWTCSLDRCLDVAVAVNVAPSTIQSAEWMPLSYSFPHLLDNLSGKTGESGVFYMPSKLKLRRSKGRAACGE